MYIFEVGIVVSLNSVKYGDWNVNNVNIICINTSD